jgi:hypothetical protein
MKPRLLTLALLVVLTSALTASQATPTRDPAGRPRRVQPRTGFAVISGIVTGLSSDQPIGEATVTIFAQGFPDGRLETTADHQGRFAFSELAAGRYFIGASKAGFVAVNHGQQRIGLGGRPILLVDGEHRQIALKLPRPSVITGVVVDERGSPLVDASVRALTFSMASGYRRAREVGGGRTDDRGIYRIHSLEPAEYAVCASTRTTAPLNAAQRLREQIDHERRRANYTLGPAGVAAQKELAPRLATLEARLPVHVDPVLGYAPVCHPGNAALPSRIRVGPEEERTGVDFQLALTRLARVEGVVGPLPVADFQLDPIMMINADDTAGDWMTSERADIDGRFTFTNVRPGRYRLTLRGSTGGTRATDARFRADADVTVVDQNIDNVVLQFRQGATVTGQIIFQGLPVPPAKVLSRLQVHLARAKPDPLSNTGTFPAVPDDSGRFVLSNVFPGDYRISAGANEPIGWFMDAATVAGRDLLDQPLVVRGSESVTGVVVTLTDHRAVLTGTIVNPQGEPAPEYLILIYAAEEKYWTRVMPRIHVTRARADGSFVINGMRAGQYRVATLIDPDYGAWSDAEYLRQLQSASMLFTIGEAEKKVLNLRVPQ